MKEWVDAILHQRTLMLPVLPKESLSAEIDVLNIFLEIKFGKIVQEPSYKSKTEHISYDHHT